MVLICAKYVFSEELPPVEDKKEDKKEEKGKDRERERDRDKDRDKEKEKRRDSYRDEKEFLFRRKDPKTDFKDSKS